MKEDGQPEPLAQPRPAPLVLKLADHLQQLVGVVVYPARTANQGDAEADPRTSSPAAGVPRTGLRPWVDSRNIRGEVGSRRVGFRRPVGLVHIG